MSDLSVLDEFDAVLPVGRKLTETERREIQEIQDRIRQDGRLYAVDAAGNSLRDAAGQPITRDYQVVRGKRFMVDAHGILWRFFPRGGPKDRRDPTGGGPPRRYSGAEMWTGKWRPCIDPRTGRPTYAKRTVIVPIDPNVNAHPRISNVDWYRTEKGYKHPFDPPDCPSELEIRAMDRRRLGVVEAVYAKMDELAKEGLDVESLKAADPAIQAARDARAAAKKAPPKKEDQCRLTATQLPATPPSTSARCGRRAPGSATKTSAPSASSTSG